MRQTFINWIVCSSISAESLKFDYSERTGGQIMEDESEKPEKENRWSYSPFFYFYVDFERKSQGPCHPPICLCAYFSSNIAAAFERGRRVGIQIYLRLQSQIHYHAVDYSIYDSARFLWLWSSHVRVLTETKVFEGASIVSKVTIHFKNFSVNRTTVISVVCPSCGIVDNIVESALEVLSLSQNFSDGVSEHSRRDEIMATEFFSFIHEVAAIIAIEFRKRGFWL